MNFRKLNAAQANLSASQAECESLRSELESERAKSASVAEQVNAKAAALVASAGHAPVAIGAGSDDKISPAKGHNILEQFLELRGRASSSEWMAFLKQNRSAIIAAAKTNKRAKSSRSLRPARQRPKAMKPYSA